jgi:hypothetical protein
MDASRRVSGRVLPHLPVHMRSGKVTYSTVISTASWWQDHALSCKWHGMINVACVVVTSVVCLASQSQTGSKMKSAEIKVMTAPLGRWRNLRSAADVVFRPATFQPLERISFSFRAALCPSAMFSRGACLIRVSVTN